MITGVPGSGKTALVQKWLHDRESDGLVNHFTLFFGWKNPIQGPPVTINEADGIPNRPSPMTAPLFRQAAEFFSDLLENKEAVPENQRGNYCGLAFRKLGGLMVIDGMEAFQRLSQAAQKSPQDVELGSPLQMSLLPDRWAATHPQHVHHERLRDKQLVAENKLFYRLQAGLAGSHSYAAAASHSLPTE